MSTTLTGRAAASLFAVVLVPMAHAQGGPGCPAAIGAPLTVGTVTAIAPGAARSYGLSLKSGEGVIIDLASLSPVAPAASGNDDGDKAPQPRDISFCDSAGKLLAPQPGEVFEKGGSYTVTADAQRLRFVAPVAAQYVVSVAAGTGQRELLVRRREIGADQSPVIASALDKATKGIASSKSPMVYSFAGPAGQWVEIKSTSEKDTLLRFAGPDRQGIYSVMAENDDTDELNPVIRRKLNVTGTFYVQVDSLSDEAAEFDLTIKRIETPKPPPPPASLRAGSPVTGRLTGSDDVKLYGLPVVAGRSYRLELDARYDGVVAIGLPNPVEPDNGSDGPDAGFSEVKSQDAGTSGTERLNFTARSTGQLLVRVKSFGIGDGNGDYTLKAIDLGE